MLHNNIEKKIENIPVIKNTNTYTFLQAIKGSKTINKAKANYGKELSKWPWNGDTPNGRQSWKNRKSEAITKFHWTRSHIHIDIYEIMEYRFWKSRT